jgi:uncharacterized protein with PIN domain
MTQSSHASTQQNECVAYLRFYAELNDFLPSAQRQRTIRYPFHGHPAIVDVIESLGVPHVEVDLVLANGDSVAFDYPLQPGDRLAIYPVFESLDISPVVRLRPQPLRHTAFVLDVHLGKLARLLRMLGLDARYDNHATDDELVDTSLRERRIILTRDLGLLKRAAVTHGYWVRSTVPLEQAREVVRRFDLRTQVQPLTRCLRCNGPIEPVDKQEVRDQIPPRTAAWCKAYYRCTSCGQVYWPGTHYERMQETIAQILS